MTFPMGGTELTASRINTLDPFLLNKCQIIHSRIREELDPDKVKIYVLHDLPTDSEVQHLRDGGWKKFDKLVFVSHWQQNQYHHYLNIPYDAGIVMPNGIYPFKDKIPLPRNPGKVRLIYTSTPHRGLNILDAVFKNLRMEYSSKIELTVYSSYNIYGSGWENAEKNFEPLYDSLRTTEGVSYHKSVSNDKIREELLTHDIFVLPSVWPETSCLALIEAMAAGLICVHSSLGALPETSMGLTSMYQYSDNIDNHLNNLYYTLKSVIDYVLNNKDVIPPTQYLSNTKYNWNSIKGDWELLIRNLIQNRG